MFKWTQFRGKQINGLKKQPSFSYLRMTRRDLHLVKLRRYIQHCLQIKYCFLCWFCKHTLQNVFWFAELRRGIFLKNKTDAHVHICNSRSCTCAQLKQKVDSTWHYPLIIALYTLFFRGQLPFSSLKRRATSPSLCSAQGRPWSLLAWYLNAAGKGERPTPGENCEGAEREWARGQTRRREEKRPRWKTNAEKVFKKEANTRCTFCLLRALIWSGNRERDIKRLLSRNAAKNKRYPV